MSKQPSDMHKDGGDEIGGPAALVRRVEGSKILVLVDFYPSKRQPAAGVFIRNQLRMMHARGARLGLLVARNRVPFLEWISSDHSAVPRNQEVDDGFALGTRHVPVIHWPTRWLFEHCGVMMYNEVQREVRKWHREVGFDAILANGIMPSGYVAVRLGKEMKLPVSVYAIGSDVNVYPGFSPRSRALTVWTLRHADIVLSVSRASATKMCQICRPRRVEIVYRGCDLQRYSAGNLSKKEARLQLGLPIEARILVFVGRLHQAKGIRELCEAYRQVKERYPRLHLVLVGDGPLRGYVERRFQANGWEDDLTITGFLDNTKVPPYYAAADIFVLPSYREGMPNSLVEGMAMGRCCIASDIGGVSEILHDERNGIVIQPRDVQGLAAALGSALGDADLRARLGAAAHQTAVELLDSRKNTRRIVAVLDELVCARDQARN